LGRNEARASGPGKAGGLCGGTPMREDVVHRLNVEGVHAVMRRRRRH
jgi:hypothetical protein